MSTDTHRHPAPTTAADGRRSTTLRVWIATHEVTTFFAFAFAFSWLLWLGPALGLRGAVGALLLYVGVFGPAVAAATLTRVGGGSLRAWLRELVRFRARPRWYGAVIGFPIVLVAATTSAFALTGGAIEPSLLGERLAAYAPLVLIWTLAALGEEPGWRGFALPRLLERLTPVRATVLLGLLWALWHLPLLAAADEPSHGLGALPLVGVTLLTLAAIVGYAFLYTYLWNRTRNVWLAILFHGTISGAIGAFVLVPSDEQVGGTYAHLQAVTVGVLAVAVLALVWATRGRLGLPERETPYPGARSRPRRESRRWLHAGLPLLLGVAFTAVLAGSTRAADLGVGATTTSRIDRFVEEQVDARHVPVLALAIVRGDEVVHARGFGSADAADA